MTQTQETINAWLKSYKSNAMHALRDAQTNLPGFKLDLQDALQRFSADYAFSVAIRHTITRLIKAEIKRHVATVRKQVGTCQR